MSDKRYPGLDGLRGLAAFLVILHHTALKGTDIGGLSVFLFFALSGFLITGILARQRREIEAGRMTRREALGQFWTQRALRIFPAYFFWLAVFLPFDSLLFHGQTLDHLLWYLLYAQNFLIGYVTQAWGDFTHTWSLAVEQQYYVFFAPLLLAMPGRRHARFFAAAIAVCFAAGLALAACGFDQVTLYTSPSTGFVFMAAGGLLAILPAERGSFLARPQIVVAALAATAFLAVYPMLERAEFVRLPYLLLIAASAVSLATLLKATLAAPRSFAVRLLESAPLLFLGKISYALYIVHLPLSYWAHEASALDWADGVARDLVEFAFVTPASLALATFSYHFVEAPFLKLKARLKSMGTLRPGAKVRPADPRPSDRAMT
ncbi:acyltransferase family protein [Methylocystis parvus]|uniref:acyltransferase family protein n=1 Tax=Methylocystis parvus TaxID=134 RepID=UPI0003178AB8|nr:acyltransferase [Methylocystis parvus]WBK00418.1 acyltransferase [Methylocystis parvus OBBP]